MKKVAVLQSNYLPWKGYFDLIHDVDEFVFYDEVQYTKNDWRNRNKIYTANGLQWLTVPVVGSITQHIDEVEPLQNRWQKKHYQSLLTNYAKAPFFHLYKDFFAEVYLGRTWKKLFELNRFLIEHISKEFLAINTKFSDSRQYPSSGTGHYKLLSLLESAGTDWYISGPAAKDYIIAADYERNQISLNWKDYAGYPEYTQLYQPYEAHVSIIDLLFNTGPDAAYYVYGWR